MIASACLHPHVVSLDDEHAECWSCGARFGHCSRHGIHVLVDRAGCPKCRPAALGHEKLEAKP
jgi:hypothetical protein